MIHRQLLLLFFVAIGLIVIIPITAFSQYAKDKNFFYLHSATALSSYFGDLNSINTDKSFFGFALQGGIGYQITPEIAVAADYRVGDYPRTDRPRFTGYTRSHTANVYGVYSFLPDRLFSPYVIAGAGMTFYGTYETNQGFDPVFGPMAGIGVDIRLTDQITLFAQGKVDFILDDTAMDMRRGDAGFDALGFFGAGVKINLRSTFRPVTRIRIAGPEEVHVAEPVSFQAELSGNPSEPVTVRWFFGDGNRAVGRSVSNVFLKTGTYTVTAISSDRRGDRETRREVRVIEAPVAASIKRLSVNGSMHTVDEPVEFSAEVEGTEPITFRWDFGDGNTSDEKTPSHTFTSEGTYTITLRVDNSQVAGKNGAHERSTVIDVYNPEPIELEDIPIEEEVESLTELQTIYFNMGSVQLDSEATYRLSQNVELLEQYLDYCVQIDVFTDTVGNPQLNLRLSEQRSRAVERFYVDRGIDPARISRTGLGELNEPCPPGDPGPGCRAHRRAESIPQRCD